MECCFQLISAVISNKKEEIVMEKKGKNSNEIG